MKKYLVDKQTVRDISNNQDIDFNLNKAFDAKFVATYGFDQAPVDLK